MPFSATANTFLFVLSEKAVGISPQFLWSRIDAMPFSEFFLSFCITLWSVFPFQGYSLVRVPHPSLTQLGEIIFPLLCRDSFFPFPFFFLLFPFSWDRYLPISYILFPGVPAILFRQVFIVFFFPSPRAFTHKFSLLASGSFSTACFFVRAKNSPQIPQS